MYNLKTIQRTILIISLAVFGISFVLMLIYAISSPNGFLANSLGTKPITALTTTNVQKFSYGQKMSIAEDVKIITDKTTIVSNSIDGTLDSDTSLTLSGLIYIKNTDAINIKLSATVSVDLTPGEYFVNSNPIRVHVLSGVASNNLTKIATANQSATWLVDKFKTVTLNTDDFVLNSNYSNLTQLLKDINLIPSQLSNLSFDLNSITDAIVQVSDSEEITENAGCESDLLTIHLLCDINKYRIENNLPALELDEDLNQLTLSHVVWMDSNQSTSSIESNGLSYKERCNDLYLDCIAEINIKFTELNELTIYNQVIQNSNILNKDSTLIGMNVSGNYLSILLR